MYYIAMIQYEYDGEIMYHRVDGTNEEKVIAAVMPKVASLKEIFSRYTNVKVGWAVIEEFYEARFKIEFIGKDSLPEQKPPTLEV